MLAFITFKTRRQNSHAWAPLIKPVVQGSGGEVYPGPDTAAGGQPGGVGFYNV